MASCHPIPRGVSSEVEHSAFNRLVVGSIPTRPTTSLISSKQATARKSAVIIHRFALGTLVLNSRWKIHKFGGSSLADAECFRRVAGLLLEYADARIGVVVSAMGGMTDALLNLAALAERD